MPEERSLQTTLYVYDYFGNSKDLNISGEIIQYVKYLSCTQRSGFNSCYHTWFPKAPQEVIPSKEQGVSPEYHWVNPAKFINT